MNFTWKYIKNRAINIAKTERWNVCVHAGDIEIVKCSETGWRTTKKIHGFITRGRKIPGQKTSHVYSQKSDLHMSRVEFLSGHNY